MFNLLQLKSKKTFLETLPQEEFEIFFKKVQPQFIFHLAAQPIVAKSYKDPMKTIITNCVGTASVLEALRKYQKDCVAVMVTSDKAYRNLEWIWGYKETDVLGGDDIYSGSKGAAELIIHSYIKSFFSDNNKIRIGVGRAGNVIGGETGLRAE